MLSRTLQAAPGSEFARVLCFFLLRKKALLTSGGWRPPGGGFWIEREHCAAVGRTAQVGGAVNGAMRRGQRAEWTGTIATALKGT